MDEQVHWRGMGRWLSFVVAALLIVAAVPNFATNDAAAGWNIFLGLLLFGAVASGSRRAPLLVMVLVGLMALRSIIAVAAERSAIGALLSAVLFICLFFAWRDLRRQAALIEKEARQQP